MPEDNLPTPQSILKQAIKAVPAVKYALGIGGIIAVIAIVVGGFKIDFRVAVFGTVIMLFLMVILVLLAKLASQASANFHSPILVLTWFCLILFMAIAGCLFTSVFFGAPLDLRLVLAASNHDEKKTEDKGPQKVYGTAQLEVQAPPGYVEPPHDTAYFEAKGDDSAYMAIRNSSNPQNQVLQPGSADWAIWQQAVNHEWSDAVNAWNRALDHKPNPQALTRLHHKIRGDSAIICYQQKRDNLMCHLAPGVFNSYLDSENNSGAIHIVKH